MARLSSVVVLVQLFFSLHCGNCSSQLYVSKIDPDVAQGMYGSTDVGIIFNSTTSSLSITDMLGNQILEVYETVHYQRWIVIEGSVFVQLYSRETQQYRDYYVPRIMYRDTHLSRQLNFTVLKFLNTLSPRFHYVNLQRSVQILMESPYVESIRKAAYTLGSELQLHGNNYPSLLPLYLVANMLEKLQMNSYLITNKSSSKGSCKVRGDDCFDECPPCPDEECLSLCGYGCSCWKWVCGDCCYHLGCYGHDICCRENFIQTKCLFPISFKCESEYEC